MPSKRTNDSVERILQELNREQEAKGIRDGITDSNVDDILRTIPRSTAPEDTFTATLGPISDADMPAVEVSGDLKDPESRFSTQAINDLLADLPIFQNQAAADAAHIPASGRAAASAPARQASSARPAQTPAQAPARAAAQTPAQTRRTAPQPQSRPQPQPEPRPQPAAQPEQQPAAEAQKPGRTGTVDTTRTGIIKNFLRQMGTDDGVDNTQLSQRKNQFQRFFEESIAVVPGKDGKLPADKKKSRKRGLFGRGGDAGEVTDEFVPINVSLLGRRDDTAPQPAREEPREEPEQAPEEEAAPAPRPRRKGFLGLFGRRAQEQTYSDTYAGDTHAGTESDTGSYPVDDLTPEQPGRRAGTGPAGTPHRGAPACRPGTGKVCLPVQVRRGTPGTRVADRYPVLAGAYPHQCPGPAPGRRTAAGRRPDTRAPDGGVPAPGGTTRGRAGNPAAPQKAGYGGVHPPAQAPRDARTAGAGQLPHQ